MMLRMDSSLLIIGMVFGSFGLGYFIYGKKQKSLVALGSGVGLFLVPYISSDIVMVTAAGLLLMAAPFIIKF